MVQLSLGTDSKGKRRRYTKYVQGTKVEAERELAKLVAQVSTVNLGPKVRLEDYLVKQWLPSKSRLEVMTLENYEGKINLHILPELGSTPLSRLSPLQLDRWLDVIRAKGLSEQSCLHVYRILHAALEQAVKWQMIDRNPLKSVQPPKPKESDILRPTLEEALQIIDLFRFTDLGPFVALALGGGLRRSEALGARWVDLDDREISVEQKRVRPKGGLDVYSKPKTTKSRRTFTLAAWATELLREARKSQLERQMKAGEQWPDTGLIVVSEDGEPLSPWTVSHRFTNEIRKAGIRPITTRGLRHGFATLSVFAGVDLPTLSKRMGHSNTKTTEIYFEVLREADREAAAKLDRLFNKA